MEKNKALLELWGIDEKQLYTETPDPTIDFCELFFRGAEFLRKQQLNIISVPASDQINNQGLVQNKII